MVVDTHGYCGKLAGATYDLDAFSNFMDACGIDIVLLGNISAASTSVGGDNLDEMTANLACLDACESRERFLPLYWTRVTRIDSHPYAFAGALAKEPFVGVVFSLPLNPFPIAVETLDPYLSVMGRLRVPGIIHLGDNAASLADTVAGVAQRHRRVPLVLSNVNGPGSWETAVDLIRQSQRRDEGNLYLDTMNAGVDQVIDAARMIGAERIMFGSGAAWDPKRNTSDTQAFFSSLIKRVPIETFERIVGGNAGRVFGLSGKSGTSPKTDVSAFTPA